MTVLVGEDEREVREYFETALGCHGFAVRMAEDGDEVLDRLEEGGEEISALIMDVLMPRLDGLEVLQRIRDTQRKLPIIMVSGESSPKFLIEAMRSGANDFLRKPVGHEELAASLVRVLGGSKPILASPESARQRTGSSDGAMFSAGASMQQVREILAQIGPSDIPVLIRGETGTGKEVVARQLHAQSTRSRKPFIKVNCAALPSELVESELFGYERGAFTGAFQRKPGIFELADGGTVFLDEIGDMDYKLQAKLLQVLQDKEFNRLGGKEPIRVDVRVLAATHQDLDEAIVNRAFREDLYYRLNVVSIYLPALRERLDELIPLADFLLKKLAQGAPTARISPSLQSAMLEHDWPGNVRELENVIRKLIVLRDPERVRRDLLTRRRVPQPPGPSRAQNWSALPARPSGQILEKVNLAKQQAETEVILEALNGTNWNRKQAARVLNIHYKALLYKMKRLSIGTGLDSDSDAA